MSVAILLVAIVPALLVAAAFFDLTTYTIPNLLPGAMLVLFARVHAHARRWRPPDELERDRPALSSPASSDCFWAWECLRVGWVGGGDAKLFAAMLLWLGWDALYDYVILACLLGGVLTLG